MGVWSDTAFGNDSAMDWLDVMRERAGAGWSGALCDVLQRFDAFEASRASEANKKVRTAERAEQLINAFDPSLDGGMAEMVRSGIGREFEYPGDDETYQLIAAAALILAVREGTTQALPPDAQALPLDRLVVTDAMRTAFVRTLGKVPNNKMLCRDCGPAWQRKVAQLAQALESVL